MELKLIYQPVAADLEKINQALQAVGQVEFDWLSRMLEHSLKGGGKRIRPALTLLSGKFYSYNLDFLLPMALSMELMHTATLVHDDAIDKSDTRRGQSTINKLWGTEPSILLGDYLFARAAIAVSETQSIRAIRLFSETLLAISQAELSQARNAFNLNQNRDSYIQRILGKTASLFCLATQSGGILTGAPEEAILALKEYGQNLGIAFQIVDDILDFIGSEEELGKPAGSDLAQGTLTLPAMLLIERNPRDNPVQRLFTHRDQIENIPMALEQVRKSAVVDESFQIAERYCQAACQSLDPLPRNEGYSSLVSLADFIVTRRI